MANRSDNCNRTASPPGTPSDGGSDWVVGGTWGCGFDPGSGRTVLYNLSAGTSAALDCGASNHRTEAVLVRNDGGAGVTCRWADDSNYYLLNVAADGSTELYKKVAGSFTSLGAGSLTVSVGDTIAVEVTGTTITAKVNGATTKTATDSALSAGTHGGCRGNGFDFYDEIAITDLSGGGGIIPQPYYALLLGGIGGPF